MERTIYGHKTLQHECGIRCRNCGTKTDIEYHHIIPLSLGGNDTLSNIVPLCSTCHELLHFGKNNEISHSEATKRGVAKARAAGKQIGRKTGVKVETAKSVRAKGMILSLSSDFRGYMTDKEVMLAIGSIARNTYYKYKKELKHEASLYGMFAE